MPKQTSQPCADHHRSRLIARLAAMFLVLLLSSNAHATALLSETLELHLPWLLFENSPYRVDMTFSPPTGAGEFRPSAISARSKTPPPEVAALLAEDLSLHIPLVSFEGEWYSLDLAPDYETAAFRVAGAAPFQWPSDRGSLVTADYLGSKTREEIATAYGLFGVQPAYGVSLFKIVYRTADLFGAPAAGSGLLALPAVSGKALPLLSYQHPTITLRSEAPSEQLWDIPTVVMASSGYVVSSPDYSGFGESPGLHAYVHAKSLAVSVIDMLRAVRTGCEMGGVPLNGQLFLAGYSEGGYATMAAHKELENHYAAEFRITASAPAAGPYDLSGVMLNQLLSGSPVPQPYYFPYFLLAYDTAYGFADSNSELFAPPYDATIPPLFDGFHDSSAINAVLPKVPLAALSPTFTSALISDPANPVRTALRQNDLVRWVPLAPLHLYHCTTDQDVPYQNSANAYAYFIAHGAPDVALNSPAYGSHQACALPIFSSIKTWFDSLVK